MGDQLGQPRLGVGDLGAMAGQEDLPAAALHLSDEAAGPADLHIDAPLGGASVTLLISLQALDRAPEPASSADYRPMRWMDVCALAQAESVQVARTPEGLRLRLPTLS